MSVDPQRLDLLIATPRINLHGGVFRRVPAVGIDMDIRSRMEHSKMKVGTTGIACIPANADHLPSLGARAISAAGHYRQRAQVGVDFFVSVSVFETDARALT